MRYFLLLIIPVFVVSISRPLCAQVVPEWKLVSTKPTCNLTQEIKGIGKAVFTYSPGHATTFLFNAVEQAIPPGDVRIASLPPVWRSNLVPLDIGSVKVQPHQKTIEVAAVQTTTMLAQLASGANVALTFSDNAGSSTSSKNNSSQVMLDARTFAQVYKNFQRCTGELTDKSAGTMISSKNSDSAKNIQESSIANNSEADIARLASYIKRGASSAEDHRNYNSASAQIFSAEKSAQWRSISNPFACQLHQDVQKFGKAVLIHKAGAAERFYLDSDTKNIFPSGPIDIQTLPDAWRVNATPIYLGNTVVQEGAQLEVIAADTIAKIKSHLADDKKIMFTSAAQQNTKNADQTNLTRVSLESKNFAAAYKEYQKCEHELVPYTFAQVARTVIVYPEKSESLTENGKVELSKVARYIKADAAVIGVLIDAHSDNSAADDVNEDISKKQAELVSSYLAEQGISADKMTTRWHGDKYPVANNKTAAGRAQNRRVTVRLETAETRKNLEKKIAEIKSAAEKSEDAKSSVENSSTQKISAEERKVVADVNEKSKNTESFTKKENSSEAESKEKSDTKTIDKSVSKSSALKSESSSHQGKMTPEEIKKLVEGLDLIDK